MTGQVKSYRMNQEQGQRLKSPHDEAGYLALGSNQTGDMNPHKLNMDKLKRESSSTEVYQKTERYLHSGGARNFYLGGAEEYTACQQLFDLSTFHKRN